MLNVECFFQSSWGGNHAPSVGENTHRGVGGRRFQPPYPLQTPMNRESLLSGQGCGRLVMHEFIGPFDEVFHV
jgi:hypothetical protein